MNFKFVLRIYIKFLSGFFFFLWSESVEVETWVFQPDPSN